VIAVDHFETARLRAEPVGPEHQADLAALFGDPRVGATLGGVRTPEQVRARILELRAHWAEHGFGWYVFRDRASDAFVGHGGPSNTHIAGRDEVEIGWIITPERWGEGLAREIGAASLEIVFGPLGLVDVVSFTMPSNRASRNVMEKLGFTFERDTIQKGEPHVLYRRLSTSSARSTSDSVV
jgi:RimJ/RimL family protein N-acetyltransferase